MTSIDDPTTPTIHSDSPEFEHALARSLDAHVVFLVNFLAPNHIEVCRELSQRLRKLTILCSVAMEGNRDWKPDWGDLDVRVQRTLTRTRRERHPSGYEEIIYTHVPLDTLGQLSRLSPDAIVSLELGARTGLASVYRSYARRCALVTSVYASQRSEEGRGRIRETVRKQLLRAADWITYDGPSCLRYLKSIGGNEDKMSPWEHAADPRKPYRGPIETPENRDTCHLLTVGQLTDRKGVMPAAEQLADWCRQNPAVQLHWHLVGSGPLLQALQAFSLPENLSISFHGHCDPEQIREHYRHSDAMLFPTFCDEWGLVVDESLHSGLPVIGSVHAQAVTTLVTDGENGFRFDPESEGSLAHALDQWLARTPQEKRQMRETARRCVAARTAETSARQLITATSNAIAARSGTRAPHDTIFRDAGGRRS